MAAGYNPPLQVVGFISTRRGDAERGPAVKVRADDAKLRGVNDGELVWIYGPRRHDLATVIVDDTLPRGGVIVRDVAGLAPTEIVRLVRPNAERPVLNPKPV
ncbi:MAG: molybdopterin dinucleotide binding domain-containing protein [Gemmatimonadaceae bacterium]